ncbi:hypothetical protein [Trueperella bialowiezensis]|uniref:Uncharacterized protein n=1 Tax=Trueperella bialowiezensis TaxID=312285 RepID=A0A448PFS8_9ACTO|nr:hypothetical protein [Trueperella bialowiezensis]VEI13799.1 Uncharacterised protein [Trueperella bialowiezensis]
MNDTFLSVSAGRVDPSGETTMFRLYCVDSAQGSWVVSDDILDVYWKTLISDLQSMVLDAERGRIGLTEGVCGVAGYPKNYA